MSLRQLILATVGAVALLGATLGSAVSQDVTRGTMSVTIAGGGPLIASISASPSLVMTDDAILIDCASFEELRVTVGDKRGLANGWSVLMAVQPDTEVAGFETLTMWPRVISVQAGNPDLAGHSVVETMSMSALDTPLWSTADTERMRSGLRAR